MPAQELFLTLEMTPNRKEDVQNIEISCRRCVANVVSVLLSLPTMTSKSPGLALEASVSCPISPAGFGES